MDRCEYLPLVEGLGKVIDRAGLQGDHSGLSLVDGGQDEARKGWMFPLGTAEEFHPISVRKSDIEQECRETPPIHGFCRNEIRTDDGRKPMLASVDTQKFGGDRVVFDDE